MYTTKIRYSHRVVLTNQIVTRSRKRAAVCYINQLSPECLQLIFNYLPVVDLLHSRRVCKYWHLIIKDKNLWNVVSLANSHIVDWPRAVQWFLQCATTSLDFRRSILGGHCMYTEQNIGDLVKLHSLRYLCIGPVTAELLYLIADNLHNLTVLRASKIIGTDEDTVLWSSILTFNVNCLAKLTNLHELRLSGNATETCKLYNGLTALTKLKKLRTLSLNEFMCPYEELEKLGKLNQLEELDVSLVVNGNKNINFNFDSLGKLHNLKTLRLGYPFICCDRDQITAFGKLTQLRFLELTDLFFLWGEEFGCALQKLTNLETLSLVVNMVDDDDPLVCLQRSVSNRGLLDAVPFMVHIPYLCFQYLPMTIVMATDHHTSIDSNESENQIEMGEIEDLEGEHIPVLDHHTGIAFNDSNNQIEMGEVEEGEHIPVEVEDLEGEHISVLKPSCPLTARELETLTTTQRMVYEERRSYKWVRDYLHQHLPNTIIEFRSVNSIQCVNV